MSYKEAVVGVPSAADVADVPSAAAVTSAPSAAAVFVVCYLQQLLQVCRKCRMETTAGHID